MRLPRLRSIALPIALPVALLVALAIALLSRPTAPASSGVAAVQVPDSPPLSPSPNLQCQQSAEQAIGLLAPAATPATQLDAVESMARSWAKAAGGPGAIPGPAPSATPPEPVSIPDALPQRSQAPARAPIPDLIERSSGTSQGGDPLQPMALQAELIKSDPNDVPLVLLELRADQRPSQARLRQSADATQGAGAWFEAGDIPAQDWTLVSVDRDAATLMSALGQLVRLPLAARSEHEPPGD